MTPCICGHDANDHNGPIGDCQARCLCEECPDDTRNDCWCAGFKDGCTVYEPDDGTDEPELQWNWWAMRDSYRQAAEGVSL